MVDAIDRLMPSQSATHLTCVFQVALGSLTPEMQLRGPGGVHIFNNSLGDPHVPWGWKPTYLGMVCVDFLPLENQIETQFRVEIFLIEYQNHFRYLAQRVGTPVFTAEAEAGPAVGPAEENRWTLPGRMQRSNRAFEGVSRTNLFAHVRHTWESVGEMDFKGTRNPA